MVTLTKLNGTPLVVNAEMIETLEATPDTIVTLTTGKKILVKEEIDKVIERIVDYRRQVLKNLIFYKEEGGS